ncbi:predicted protein [Chaetomium globosum CBS 148.51]|uniref:Uncharacterized protein n=1 Tax=Chaetomium globosum (strain ATCC 6205 / CBS 148.51 / DSM 1962 / NBRC 6347 / NRRL 1970) TaxID=306901 RepID=Q2GV23_CHAGB|nr:uncharacterized protein CHGG_08181 [Chaetomium globosum CBS 148.51]EAQ86928.1 predicted protein [Chaetomium globosum CBS 148.51]
MTGHILVIQNGPPQGLQANRRHHLAAAPPGRTQSFEKRAGGAKVAY